MIGGGDAAGSSRTPRALRAYVTLLVALAAGSAFAATRLDPREHATAVMIGGLVVVLTAAEYLVVRFHYRGEIMALSLFEAVLAPALFVLPPLEVIAVVAVAQVVAAAGHRLPPLKTIFNGAQWIIGASAAASVFHVLGGGGAVTARSLAALALAMTALVVVNALAFTVVIHLAERRPLARVAADLVPPIMLGWLVNAGFGVLFVTAFARSPGAVALFLVPLIALHAASRGVAASVADQRRLGAMHGTLMSLATPTAPQEAIPRFLAGVRDCFGSASVELLLRRDGTDVLHALDVGETDTRRIDPATPGSIPTLLADADIRDAVRITPGTPSAAATALVRAGKRQCLAAPLLVDGASAGVLCVYDSTGFEGFEQGELAVLQALAGEASGMIQRATLIGEVLEERRKFAEVIESTSDGIVTLAPDGTITLWNPGMAAITGYPSTAMTGTAGCGLLAPLDQDDRSPVSFDDWPTSGTLPPEAIEVTSANGEIRSLTCSYTPVRDDAGTPTVLVIVARDVTRVRELEALKDDFVATVSHELRTPLTPIKGWAQMLLQRGDGDDPVERQGLEAIARQADRLERLVSDLLEVSRVERGAHDLREGAVDAVDLARIIVDESHAAHPGRQIHLDIPTEACVARADAMWVERIIGNLLSNAMKYAPASKPVAVRVGKSGGSVSIDVIDHGPGITEKDRERIFERFARLGEHNTRIADGAGLGLYIARRLAASMGGTLTVASDPGVQTTFTLRLPAAVSLVAVPDVRAAG